MTDPSFLPADSLSEEAATALLRSLLQKEGNWVDWGAACQQLHQAGHSHQSIFEQTGFQSSQQNLIVVAAQVFESLKQEGVDPAVLDYYRGPKSDILYELRILNQSQRAAAATLACEKRLEFDAAKQLAKAIQSLARMPAPPDGFSDCPGDAMAYQYWKWARQKKDLQERARLIALGLKFAHSPTAREAIEKLLIDFTVVPARKAPMMPVYRLEAEEEIARIVPVAGSLPLSAAEIRSVPRLDLIEPFRLVSCGGQVVPLPGWQAILKAIDPVAILMADDRLPQPSGDGSEAVLAIVDRGVREWDENAYFLVDGGKEVSIQWFESAPVIDLLGQVILILRPKRILDENNLLEPWQMDD
jgi:hypothetical protein